MRESSLYLAILDEGGVAALQKLILKQGRIRFGAPDGSTEAAIKGIEHRKKFHV
jgi:predicted transcriptional regulator